MRENIIKNKSFDFAIKIVNLYEHIVETKKEFVLSKQLLRSGTAIGAMVRASEHAESKADFIHKLSIALKEANETEYWILLLKETQYLNDEMFQSVQNDTEEIIKLLISIIKTSKVK
ncbi:MAG: four helix bundle protein [bacterium]|nr:four helix bundle protein [bacterium]